MSNPFSKLFGRSPFGPMQDHMSKSFNCAEQLIPFFQAVLAEDWEHAEKLQQRIAVLENEADDMKTAIRMNMPESLFMPVPRSDLLELLTVQDKIANKTKDIAGIMLGRRMRIPVSLAEAMMTYVEKAVKAAEYASRALHEIDELIETGFGRHESEVVKKMIHKIDVCEHEADKLQVTLRAQLFSLETDLPPVDVIFMYKIIDWIGDVSDRAERVGSRLQILLAK
ncbi:TIGR00153 family protein [Oceanospirillum sp.]|uniref:TIGR00153 family protein n=1 Tax=Oceanospirillum sp. TaxID=2021254 RepID=UPI003A8EA948